MIYNVFMKKTLICILSVLFIIFSAGCASALEEHPLAKVLYIGDSYCRGGAMRGDGKEHPDDAWAALSALKFDVGDYALACRGGSGIVQGVTFQELISEYLAENDDAEAIRWIIILGGANDRAHGYDEIMIGGEALINYIKDNFPNAKIALGMVGWHESNETIQQQLSTVVSPAYRDLADYTEIYYIDNAESTLFEKEGVFESDGLHPNDQGQNLLANLVVDFFWERLNELYDAEYEAMRPGPREVNPAVALAIAVAGCGVIGVLFAIRYQAAKRAAEREAAIKAAEAAAKKRKSTAKKSTKKTAKKKSSKSRKK